MVVAKVGERLSVNKQRFHTEMLNEVEGKEKYCLEVSTSF
jgi:hypothetical protein